METAPPRVRFTGYGEPATPMPLPGPQTPGLSFQRTVQPVLDHYCIGCHGLNGRTEGGLSLQRDRSYEQLVGRKGLVSVIPADPSSYVSGLRQFYAAGARLGPLLVAGHAGVTLPADLLGKQKTISQMVSINFILLSLMLTEDWPRFLGSYMKTFEQWFPTITFWLMLLTVLLTVISGVSYLIRGHRLYTHDS